MYLVDKVALHYKTGHNFVASTLVNFTRDLVAQKGVTVASSAAYWTTAWKVIA